MKKVLFIFAFCVISATVSWAQDKRIGAFLGYGSEIENLALGVNGEFLIGDTKFSISPSFVYYFTEKNSFIKTNVWELNGNVNYQFFSNDNVHVYGLGGLNYTHVSVKTDMAVWGEFKSSEGNVGLNIGAGVNFDLGNNLLPFAELKYVIGNYDQLLLAAGLKFSF